MQKSRWPTVAFYSIISPTLPFYLLGLTPGQALWPAVFLPAVLVANYAWALALITVSVVAVGQTERVGQRLLVRYALWAVVSGLIIDIGHDMWLRSLAERVDFLLEPQPWQLMAGTYVAPFLLLIGYHVVLSWQYLRLRLWQAVLTGLTFAILTAPWTTLTVLDYGQGRMPAPAQRLLWFSLLIAGLSPWLIGASFTLMRHGAAMRRVSAALLTVLAVLVASLGGALWMRSVAVPALGALSASGMLGDLAFTTRGRLYTAHATDGQIRPLGQAPGQVVAWSPNGGALLVNEERPDGKTYVVVVPSDSSANSKTLGEGLAGPNAWSPDGQSIVYVTPTDSTGQIHVALSNGSNDRIVAEGRTASWSPDGRRLVYSARGGGRWQVWVMLPTGADPIQLTSEGGEDPLWAPDGRLIAYVQNNRVQVMDADGANKRRLPVDSAFVDVRPLLAWAGDGVRLSYAYVYPPESGRATQLYVWDTSTPALPLTGSLAPLTTPTSSLGRNLNRSGDFRPPLRWAPTAEWITFTRRGDVWALNLKTDEERRLSPGDSFAWSGRTLGLVVRPVPTYPPTPTPTPLPPTVVESPSVLVIDPRDPAIVLAGAAAGVVRRTASGGWFLNNTGIAYPTRVRTLAFDPASAVVYAGTDGQRSVAGALYKSIDGGQRWTASGLKDVDVYRVVIDPRLATTLYAGTSKGVYVSFDGAATWRQINNELKTTTVLALAVDPAPARTTGRATPATSADSVLYLGTRQGEIYKSINGGGEWRLVQTLNASVTSILVYSRKGTVLLSSEEGLFSSNDGGETWNQVSGGIWKVRLDGLVPHPKEDTVYAHGAHGVYVSHDGGANWGPASTGLEGTQPSALVIDPANPSILYVGTDKGVYRTSNGGVTWTR